MSVLDDVVGVGIDDVVVGVDDEREDEDDGRMQEPVPGQNLEKERPFRIG